MWKGVRATFALRALWPRRIEQGDFVTAYLAPKGHSNSGHSLRKGLLGAAMTAGVGIALLASAAPANAFLFGGFQREVAPSYIPNYGARPSLDLDRPAAKIAKPKHRPGPLHPKVNAELAAKATGPLTMIISLDKQELVLWANGQAVARSRVSTGTRANPTPTGVFSVIEKDRWHWSNLYDSAPMHFMHRITWSGLALHQGIVPNYPASHGCIRLPESFVSQLWGVTRMGARVIITRGEAAPVSIAHAKLFAPAPKVPALISRINPVPLAHDAADTNLKMVQLVGLKTIATATDASEQQPAADAGLKPGPVSVFISRREGKLFVRKGFAPVFDVPVTIDRPTEALGTNVFTAMAVQGDKARWQVVSVPSRTGEALPTAGSALDRITIPQDAQERINALMTAGASLIVSDQGLGPETGKGTDFIVLTR
jgi:lipoprotein-anchoring transpeptidase ErfK/SrfK